MNRALRLSFDALTTPEQLALLERCERFRRCLPAVEHPLINQVSEHADATELGGKLPAALANRLRITRGEASRRIHEAADLGERKAITGEPLPPRLEATAAAQRAGDIGAGHVAVIRGFMHRLPDFVDVETGQKAEAQLARLGTEHRPDELSQAGRQADRLPQSRRQLLRRRPSPPTRHHHRPTRHRRHVPDQRVSDSGGSRHP